MRMSAQRDPARGIVAAAAKGSFDEEEFSKILRPFYEATPRGAHLLFLLDLRAVEEPPSAQALLGILEALGRERPKVPVLAAAIAAADLGPPAGRALRPLKNVVGLSLALFPATGEALDWLKAGLE